MSQLWQLFRLSGIDHEIDLTVKNKNSLVNPETRRGECDEIEKQISVHTEKKKNLHLKLKKIELETDSIIGNIKKLEDKIYSGKTQSHKELQSWQKEVQNLKKKQENKEEQCLEIMEQAEALDNLIAECKDSLLKRHRELTQESKRYTKELKGLEKKLTELKAEQEKLVAKIDSNLIKKYNQIRLSKDDGIAVVEILKNVCGGCYMNVPDSMIKRVQSHELVQCNSCMRILYWEERKKTDS